MAASFLRAGIAWLSSQRAAKLSELMTYQRAAGGSVALYGTMCRTDEEQLIASGEFIVNSQWKDFKFAAADLLAGSAGDVPKPGDRVTVSASGATYEVAELGGGRCWRWADEYERDIRVHTRMIETGWSNRS